MSKSFHDTPLGGSYMTHLEGHTPLVCRQTHLPHDQLSDNILSGQLWSEIALRYYKFAFPFFLGLRFPWKCFSGMMAGNISSIPRWKSSLEIKFLHWKSSIYYSSRSKSSRSIIQVCFSLFLGGLRFPWNGSKCFFYSSLEIVYIIIDYLVIKLLFI